MPKRRNYWFVNLFTQIRKYKLHPTSHHMYSWWNNRTRIRLKSRILITRRKRGFPAIECYSCPYLWTGWIRGFSRGCPIKWDPADSFWRSLTSTRQWWGGSTRSVRRSLTLWSPIKELLTVRLSSDRGTLLFPPVNGKYMYIYIINIILIIHSRTFLQSLSGEKRPYFLVNLVFKLYSLEISKR